MGLSTRPTMLTKTTTLARLVHRAAPTALVALLALACAPASKSDPAFWEPFRGSGGGSSAGGDEQASAVATGAGAGGAGGGGASPGSSLTFRFTTVSVNGEYDPKNIGAVWIADGKGAFLKTLELWAAKRAKHLVKWRAASGSNVVDAVTGPTRGSHVAHESLWDFTDVAGKVVPDGAYRVNVEFTESNSASEGDPGPFLSVDFMKGLEPQEFVVPDQPAFTAIHLVTSP